MKIHLGCCGFPVARPRYYKTFRCVEVDSTFYRPPMASTAGRWRAEAPEGFEFAVKAWQVITHLPSSPTYRKLGRDRPVRLDRCGHFKASDEVRWAWERTAGIARILKARLILFQTPATFLPDADRLRDLYAFFRKLDRAEFVPVWEPRGTAWTERQIARVCSDLALVHGVDPLRGRPVHGGIRYYRLHGAYEGGRIAYRHRYTDEQLAALARLCGDKPSYVFFNNSEMFEDAQRFLRQGIQKSLG